MAVHSDHESREQVYDGGREVNAKEYKEPQFLTTVYEKVVGLNKDAQYLNHRIEGIADRVFGPGPSKDEKPTEEANDAQAQAIWEELQRLAVKLSKLDMNIERLERL